MRGLNDFLIDQINAARRRIGCQAVLPHPNLMHVARIRLEEMLALGEVSHFFFRGLGCDVACNHPTLAIFPGERKCGKRIFCRNDAGKLDVKCEPSFKYIGELQIEGGLNSGVSREVSQQTGVPEAQVYGVGSFFDLLTDTDKKVRVCTGLSCRMAGADQVLQAMEDAGLPAMGCSCLAACDRPPAVLRDRDVLPAVSVEDVVQAEGDWTRLRPEIVSSGNLGHVGPEVDDPDTMAINLLGQADWSGKGVC